MAATSASLIADSQTCTVEQDKTTYTCTFQVFVNSALDGPKVVSSYLIANGYALGSSYAIGNDTDTSVVLKSIVPRRDPVTRDRWLATLTYETPDSDDAKDDEGNATSNPLEYYTKIRTNFVTFDTPVLAAKNLKAMPNRPINTEGPVTNSAGEIKIPPPMKTDHYLVVTITRNLASYSADVASTYMNTINSDRANAVSLLIGFQLTIPKYWGKIVNISADWQEENGYGFWHTTLEIHVKYGGWIHKELDNGLMAIAEEGAPDGEGGVFLGADIITGRPPMYRIRDAHGKFVDKPVMLDGDGKVAAVVGGAVMQTYLDYQVYREMPWGVLFQSLMP